MFLEILKHTAVWMRVAGVLAGAALAAQETSTVHISANMDGPLFYVNGQVHKNAAVYRWPAGSKQTLYAIPVQEHMAHIGLRYSFAGWSVPDGRTGTARSMENPFILTADATVPWVRAEFTVEYLIRLRFSPCVGGSCVTPGTVSVNGTPYTSDADIWCPADSTIEVLVQPGPGFAFLGWQSIPGGMNTSFVNSFVLREPTGLYPKFEQARRVELATVPAGLRINADRQSVEAPIAMEWAYNSVHTMSPVSPQMDKWGKLWVFGSWSNGQAAVHAYRVDPGSVPLQLTANYVPGARFSFRTNPAGMKVRVDGRDDWPNEVFAWGVGERHLVEAPARITDAQGRAYRFQAWSNGGPAAQEIAVTGDHAEAGGLSLTAAYEQQAQMAIRSSEPGVTFEVDGESCVAPCAIERRPGTEVRLAAPVSVATAEGMRLDFQGWSDGAPRERTLAASTEIASVTAVYRVMVRLATVADPPQACGFRADPASPDGYYEARTNVSLAIEPRPGYRFRKWEGDLAGAVPYGSLRMTGPKSVRAMFEAVPHVVPAGVGNAAGETPVGGVAPGSVISIYGSGLAGDIISGPESPLLQTLGDVTVRVGERLLPLFFVSPEQINAQLPPDVAPGAQRVVVRWEGKPEVRGDFEVMQYAPGLFHQRVEERAWGTIAREDGSLVNQQSPARKGEILTLYGTGFGPYDRAPLAGFAVPEGPRYRLEAPVAIVAGESEWQPLESFAAPGRIGIDAVRFRVPADAPSGTLELKVRVQDAESNTVLLQVE